MHLTAMGDYAVRAVAEIAAAHPRRIKAAEVARRQRIPLKFVENILITLRRAGIVDAKRGVGGGYTLARPPAAISVADVVRAVEGPLANIRGLRPERLRYPGAAQPLADLWIAVRVNLRNVLEQVTYADLARGRLPAATMRLTRRPGARVPH
jgi:Rrf2 family protein